MTVKALMVLGVLGSAVSVTGSTPFIDSEALNDNQRNGMLAAMDARRADHGACGKLEWDQNVAEDLALTLITKDGSDDVCRETPTAKEFSAYTVGIFTFGNPTATWSPEEAVSDLYSMGETVGAENILWLSSTKVGCAVCRKGQTNSFHTVYVYCRHSEQTGSRDDNIKPQGTECVATPAPTAEKIYDSEALDEGKRNEMLAAMDARRADHGACGKLEWDQKVAEDLALTLKTTDSSGVGICKDMPTAKELNAYMVYIMTFRNPTATWVPEDAVSEMYAGGMGPGADNMLWLSSTKVGCAACRKGEAEQGYTLNLYCRHSEQTGSKADNVKPKGSACVAAPTCDGLSVNGQPVTREALMGDSLATTHLSLVNIPQVVSTNLQHVYIPSLPVAQGSNIEVKCCGDSDCEVLIMLYHCRPCSTALNGGMPGMLLAAGWDAASCAPQFEAAGTRHKMSAYHKALAKGAKEVLPVPTGDVSYMAVFTGSSSGTSFVPGKWCHKPRGPVPTGPPGPNQCDVCAPAKL